MDILVIFFASVAILFFAGCMKLVFELIDVKQELREVKAANESILKHVIEIYNARLN